MTGPVILGGGVTGLAAGMAAGAPVLEARERPGGICSSYYKEGASAGGYRFEVGGGHWLFGGSRDVLGLLDELAPLRAYKRRSAVYFAATGLSVPYPLQDNLRYLGREVASRALAEITDPSPVSPDASMGDWLRATFGPTLDELFFRPFHERYMAGLTDEVAPQDPYKSPIRFDRVREGAVGSAEPSGYNVTFRYPDAGLDVLVGRLADRTVLECGAVVTGIDTRARRVVLADGRVRPYERLVSTLPLNRVLSMAAMDDVIPDPHTSVLVLNIGATKGPACPPEHWLYVPDSSSGFHRIGFYSNVSSTFVPSPDRCSLYIERAFRPGRSPSPQDVDRYEQDVIAELRALRFIDRVEVVDRSWVDVAYTWRRPGSGWVESSITRLRHAGIDQVGRYARWHFQGIADSVEEGLRAGAELRTKGCR